MVLAWIATLAAVIAITPVLAGDFDADFGTKGSESEQVARLLTSRFDRSGEFVTVAWEGADTPGAEARVDAFLQDAERLPGIGTAEGERTSPDGTIAVTQLALDRRGWDVPTETGQELIRLAEEHSTNDVHIALGGQVINNAEDGGSPEGLGLLAAAVILLIAFGSIVAAGLPLAVALFGLGISASLIGVLAAVVDVPDFAPAVAGLIGIGVGVDYALLVLTRFRAALERKPPRDAIVEAVETAGRSVLIAGTTVLISVNGLFLMGVSYLQGVALSTSLAVLAVMAASVTLLPSLPPRSCSRSRRRCSTCGSASRTPATTARGRRPGSPTTWSAAASAPARTARCCSPPRTRRRSSRRAARSAAPTASPSCHRSSATGRATPRC